MMTQSFIGLLLLTLALTPTLLAAESITEHATSQGAKMAQAGLNYQAHQNYQVADLALDNAYLQLMSSLNTLRQSQLTLAHQAWLHFRDTEAEFRASIFADGSIQPLVYAQALTELNEYRTRQLEALFNEQVGH